MREWARMFGMLAADPQIQSLCRAERVHNVFLHQHALTGAILHAIPRSAMVQLSERYNYPLFFDRQYEALRRFDSIEDVITLRRVVSLERVGSNWPDQILGPSDRITWLKGRL